MTVKITVGAFGKTKGPMDIDPETIIVQYSPQRILGTPVSDD